MTTADSTAGPEESGARRFGDVANAKYVRLTTYRKDGTPVASPLWAAMDGDRLLMWTVTDSWKVKRLRRDPRVIVQACDLRGRTVYGEPVPGTGEVLDEAGTERVRAAIARKYGLFGRLTLLGSTLRRGKNGTIGIAVTPATSSDTPTDAPD